MTGNESCTQPKVRALSWCIFIIDINVRIRISSLWTMLSLWPWTTCLYTTLGCRPRKTCWRQEKDILRSTCGTFYLPTSIPEMRTTSPVRLIISRRTRTTPIIQMLLKNTLRDLEYMKTIHTSNTSNIAKSQRIEWQRKTDSVMVFRISWDTRRGNCSSL